MRTKEGSVVDRYANNSPNTLPNRRDVGEFDDWGWGDHTGGEQRSRYLGQIHLGDRLLRRKY